MMRKFSTEGFTLVELALSMAFIGILSVAVVLIIGDTVASYRRGLTITQVNTTGMDVVDDMRTAVANSSSRAATLDCERFYQNSGEALDSCVKDGAYSFISITKYTKDLKLYGNEVEGDIPIYGAFCTGTYSYIWNSGYYEMEAADFNEKSNNKWAVLTYKKANGDLVTLGNVNENEKPAFRLLKVIDKYRGVCAGVVRANKKDDETTKRTYTKVNDIGNDRLGTTSYPTFDMSNYGEINEDPVDLISADGETGLALFDLYVAKPAESATQRNMFYSVSFILGTVEGGANIAAKGKTCEAPSNYTVENFEYCAINKFSFAVQANGIGG